MPDRLKILQRTNHSKLDFKTNGRGFGINCRYGFLQISPRDGHPCRSANTSPCRVCRGLSPPGRCTMLSAQMIKVCKQLQQVADLF